jgi:hypothetical protein
VRFDSYSFGSITIDGVVYDHDVVLDRGSISKRRKKRSKRFRNGYGHTPLSLEEPIPWNCRRLLIGTGAEGALPVMDDVIAESERQGVELVRLPTEDAIAELRRSPPTTNAVLHVTC